MRAVGHRWIYRLFHVYPGEGRTALSFALLAFLWAFPASCVYRLADALFLLNVGAQNLPFIYPCIAGVMLLFAASQLFAIPRMEVRDLHLAGSLTALLFVFFALLGHTIPSFSSSPYLWIFTKIFAYPLMMLLTTTFWNFVDLHFTVHQAKRLYCLFNCCLFMGFAASSGIMSLGYFSIQTLLITVIAFLFLNLWWCVYLAKKARRKEECTCHPSLHPPLATFLKGVIASRYTLLLCLSYFLTQLLNWITEFNYQSQFEHLFAEDYVLGSSAIQARLTLFLSSCSFYVAIGNILVGLLLYSRAIHRWGVDNIILLTPATFSFLYFGWPISHALFFPVLGFVIQEGMIYTVDDNNFNLTLNAVPSHMKNQVRALVESFVEPCSLLMGATFLILGGQSKLLGLFLSFFLLAVVWGVRRHYNPGVTQNMAPTNDLAHGLQQRRKRRVSSYAYHQAGR